MSSMAFQRPADAIRIVEVITLLAVCEELSSQDDSSKLAAAGRCTWVRWTDAEEVTVKHTWVTFAWSKENQSICMWDEPRLYGVVHCLAFLGVVTHHECLQRLIKSGPMS